MSKMVYLAGGMEYASDGKSWRDKTVAVLKEHGIESWEPYEQEAKLFNTDEQPAELIKTLDKEKDFKQLWCIMNEIVHLDMGVVRNDVDALFVKYDESVLKGAGTHAEMTMAAVSNVPVHVWIPELSIQRIPTWIIGCITTIATRYEHAIDFVVKSLV